MYTLVCTRQAAILAQKADEHAASPVKRFLGDYVATVFQLSGVRVSELFQKIDHRYV